MSEDSQNGSYFAIREYALIGDCHGAALVSAAGSLDWACLARFDASPVFARLLDSGRGGTFTLAARGRIATARRYLPDTNVVETTFTTPDGVARLYDCFTMHRGGRTRPARQLLRFVEGVEGTVTFDVVIQPRFDYGSLRPWLRHHQREDVFSAVGGDQALVVQTEARLSVDLAGASLVGELTVRPDERRRFSIVSRPPHDMVLERHTDGELDDRLAATIAWWRDWVHEGSYDETYRAEVVRSALVLKLLTCAPTGAIIAAPTTSLPEELGGQRNWDYRYSWVRDSAHTLAALLAVGHPDVATGFKLFIERATAGHAEDLQIMYGCYGERRLHEQLLPHLDGYRGSRPVRIGNGAAEQRQLDVYGELLNAAHVWRRAGTKISDDGWLFLRGLVEAACARWQEPDRGLWEVRGEPRHFVESKVMCWLALERGIQACEELDLPCDLDRWRAIRAEIRATIERDGVDRERGCFVQNFGSVEVDASLLLLPLVGFVDARDPRMLATVAAIEEDLCDGLLVRRYRASASGDGVRGGEGAFVMVSFWLVDVLAMQGRAEEAESRFQRLLALANDVGLLAEEYDAKAGAMLGNFPQAFTHMAIINSAEGLRRARSGLDAGGAVADRGNARPERPVRSATLHHFSRDA